MVAISKRSISSQQRSDRYSFQSYFQRQYQQGPTLPSLSPSSLSSSSYLTTKAASATLRVADTVEATTASEDVCPESGVPLRTSPQRSQFRAADLGRVRAISRWIVGSAYLIALLSAGLSFRRHRTMSGLIERLVYDSQTLVLQTEATNRTLLDAREAQYAAEHEVKTLARTQRLFQHELNIQEDKERLGEEHESVKQYTQLESQRQTSIVVNWAQQRRKSLNDRLQKLQTHIQNEDRRRVIEKYGPGPHHVRFDVKVVDSKKTSSFVVRLAPIDDMPHSVWTFLEMVQSGVWNHTVLYHHRHVEHIVAAGAFRYGTFEPKDAHLDALGFHGLSFAEYSAGHPHEAMTIGFAGLGPNFYINALDNTRLHGPGSQDHHVLPDEADPCFATVVEGREVVERIRQHTAMNHGTNRPPTAWSDIDVSHLVGMSVVP